MQYKFISGECQNKDCPKKYQTKRGLDTHYKRNPLSCGRDALLEEKAESSDLMKKRMGNVKALRFRELRLEKNAEKLSEPHHSGEAFTVKEKKMVLRVYESELAEMPRPHSRHDLTEVNFILYTIKFPCIHL